MMEGISAVAGLADAMSSVELQSAYTARVAQLQNDAVNQRGAMALRLIQAASVDPSVGGNVNITA